MKYKGNIAIARNDILRKNSLIVQANFRVASFFSWIFETKVEIQKYIIKVMAEIMTG